MLKTPDNSTASGYTKTNQIPDTVASFLSTLLVGFIKLEQKNLSDFDEARKCVFSRCSNHFKAIYNERMPQYATGKFATQESIECAMHLVTQLSLHEFEAILQDISDKTQNADLWDFVHFLLVNPNMTSFVLSRQQSKDWYNTKLAILEQRILVHKSESQLSMCGKDPSFAHKDKRYELHEMENKLDDVVSDGIIYNRERDPPGQKSVYILPGNPRKQSYRLITYLKASWEHVDPFHLASAGFFYTGFKDRVKCFCCGSCVEQWVHSDDVYSSRWHKDDCRFAKHEECGNIPLVHESHSSRNLLQPRSSYNYTSGTFSEDPQPQTRHLTPDMQANQFPAIPSSLHENFVPNFNLHLEFDRMMLEPSTSTNQASPSAFLTPSLNYGHDEPGPSRPSVELDVGLFPCKYPAYPNMENQQSRLTTFIRSWPYPQTNTSHRKLATAGFFYLGDEDRVKCFYCDGSLQNWRCIDNPWMEHAKCYPACEFLLRSKGTEYVHQVAACHPNLQRPATERQAIFQPHHHRCQTKQCNIRNASDVNEAFQNEVWLLFADLRMQIADVKRKSRRQPEEARFYWIKSELQKSLLSNGGISPRSKPFYLALHLVCHFSLAQFEEAFVSDVSDADLHPRLLMSIVYILAHPSAISGMMMNVIANDKVESKAMIFEEFLHRLGQTRRDLSLLVKKCLKILQKSSHLQ